jgi:hypothetical protein
MSAKTFEEAFFQPGFVKATDFRSAPHVYELTNEKRYPELKMLCCIMSRDNEADKFRASFLADMYAYVDAMRLSRFETPVGPKLLQFQIYDSEPPQAKTPAFMAWQTLQNAFPDKKYAWETHSLATLHIRFPAKHVSLRSYMQEQQDLFKLYPNTDLDPFVLHVKRMIKAMKLSPKTFQWMPASLMEHIVDLMYTLAANGVVHGHMDVDSVFLKLDKNGNAVYPFLGNLVDARFFTSEQKRAPLLSTWQPTLYGLGSDALEEWIVTDDAKEKKEPVFRLPQILDWLTFQLSLFDMCKFALLLVDSDDKYQPIQVHAFEFAFDKVLSSKSEKGAVPLMEIGWIKASFESIVATHKQLLSLPVFDTASVALAVYNQKSLFQAQNMRVLTPQEVQKRDEERNKRQ